MGLCAGARGSRLSRAPRSLWEISNWWRPAAMPPWKQPSKHPPHPPPPPPPTGESGAEFDFPQTNRSFHYLITTVHHCLHDREVVFTGYGRSAFGCLLTGARGKKSLQTESGAYRGATHTGRLPAGFTRINTGSQQQVVLATTANFGLIANWSVLLGIISHVARSSARCRSPFFTPPDTTLTLETSLIIPVLGLFLVQVNKTFVSRTRK